MCTKGVPLLSGTSPQTCSAGSFSSCPNGYSCQPSRYGMSGQQICCPSPGDNVASRSILRKKIEFPFLSANICAQQNSQGQSCGGTFGSGQVRYYYSSGSGSCQTFTYFGCGGNDNRFDTINDCQQFCSGAATNSKASFIFER